MDNYDFICGLTENNSRIINKDKYMFGNSIIEAYKKIYKDTIDIKKKERDYETLGLKIGYDLFTNNINIYKFFIPATQHLNKFFINNVKIGYENEQKEYNTKIKQDIYTKWHKISEQNVEMINYHYVFYKKDELKNNDIQPIEKDFMDEIIPILKKYSYPLCMIVNLTDDEKKHIINNEYDFIKSKFDKNIAVLQIPRIIYDLANLIYIYRNNIKMTIYFDYQKEMSIQSNEIIIDITNDKYYHSNLSELHDETKNENFKNNIININKILLEMITISFDKLQSNNKYNVIYWYDIFQNILAILFENEQALLANSEYDTYILKNLINYSKLYEYKRIKTLLKDILLLELGYFTDGQYNTSKNKILLYRGSSIDHEDMYQFLDSSKGNFWSTSYNTSILNGSLVDFSATTLKYYNPKNYKKIYIVNKFFNQDNGMMNNVKIYDNADNFNIECYLEKENYGELLINLNKKYPGLIEEHIFFIPPIHQSLLLYSQGEFWHARSKLHYNIDVKVDKISGIAVQVDNKIGFLLSCIKNKENIKKLLNFFESHTKKYIATREFIKYLKYKKKYLLLKKSNILYIE